jgi:hypothetical protein
MTQPPWSYWLDIGKEVVLHANDEQWLAQAERIARACNQAFTDGRRYQTEVEATEARANVRAYPEETGCVDLLEVE